MSEIRNNFVKRDLRYNVSIKVSPTVPVDSTKPDTTKAMSVIPEKTKAEEVVVIPEEIDSIPVSGTETIPVTVDTTVATVPSTNTYPTSGGTYTAKSNGTSGKSSSSTGSVKGSSTGSVKGSSTGSVKDSSTNSSGSIGNYGTEGLTDDETRNLTSIRGTDTVAGSILRDSTQGFSSEEFGSILSSGTRGDSNDSALAEITNGISNFYNKITTYTIKNVGTLKLNPDCNIGKNWKFGISGSFRF